MLLIHTVVKSFLRLAHIYRESLRTTFFLSPPRTLDALSPTGVLAFFLANEAIHIAIQRAYIEGPTTFYPNAFLWGGWSNLLVVWLCWLAQRLSHRTSSHANSNTPLSTLLAIILGQDVFFSLVNLSAYLLLIREPSHPIAHIQWIIYITLTAWAVMSTTVFLVRATEANKKVAGLIFTVLLGLYAVLYMSDPPWYWYAKSTESEASSADNFELSQATFERQAALASMARDTLRLQQQGRTELYAITFAPYQDDVFLNESKMVQEVLETQFDASQTLQQLINHPSTVETKPWATLENLERAINAAADKMNREEDVLLVYLTSHGGKNGELSSEFWPLATAKLTPTALNLMLDKANVKHRIIIISACYSGSWIPALKNENTLIITAADASHTSYGCGYKSELTYFGRALVDEQLRSTRNFEKAYRNAVPIIKQREIEAKKDDGFSNPQWVMGSGIKPILQQLENQPHL